MEDNTDRVIHNMVLLETGWDGVRRQDDDRKENIGMLINLLIKVSLF
jgi:hypothetical protein